MESEQGSSEERVENPRCKPNKLRFRPSPKSKLAEPGADRAAVDADQMERDKAAAERGGVSPRIVTLHACACCCSVNLSTAVPLVSLAQSILLSYVDIQTTSNLKQGARANVNRKS